MALAWLAYNRAATERASDQVGTVHTVLNGVSGFVVMNFRPFHRGTAAAGLEREEPPHIGREG